MKAGAGGIARAATVEQAAAQAGGPNGRIKRVVLAVHDFDISPRLGL
jgi:hypothetical protein